MQFWKNICTYTISISSYGNLDLYIYLPDHKEGLITDCITRVYKLARV